MATESEQRSHQKKLGYIHVIKKIPIKLNIENVIDIKTRLKNNEKINDVAKIYNVHRSTISNIKNNKKWKNIFIETIDIK